MRIIVDVVDVVLAALPALHAGTLRQKSVGYQLVNPTRANFPIARQRDVQVAT
jgi:hypothetical protein